MSHTSRRKESYAIGSAIPTVERTAPVRAVFEFKISPIGRIPEPAPAMTLGIQQVRATLGALVRGMHMEASRMHRTVQDFVSHGRAQKPACFAKTLPRGNRANMPGAEIVICTPMYRSSTCTCNSPTLSGWILPQALS
eukprot:2752249-Amphidinium_carterae.1